MSRSDFNETWLCEMPSGLGSFETWDMLKYNIHERIKYGSKVTKLSDNLFKIQGVQTSYYWFGSENTVILGTELRIKPEGLVVNITGKDPNYRGRAPFASDLYNAVLDDMHRSIRLLSDEQLSDEGYNIWKKLVIMGHKVSIYNKKEPGKTFKTFDSPEEMAEFFKHDDTNFMQYQYVLSEIGECIAETNSTFNTRRYRELCGLELS